LHKKSGRKATQRLSAWLPRLTRQGTHRQIQTSCSKKNQNFFSLTCRLSSNSFIVYDDDEVLIVDVGGIYDPYTDNELMPALKPLLVSRRLNGAYLTHGHIDHIGQLAHLTTLLPGIKLFVADQGTKDEAKQLNATF
jgi:glyoxylase-like metal-dependent hydrolase (beta-lactamase superfamily II)